MSYAAIIGGTCTLIGTSTNLVVDGLLREQTDASLSMFSPALVGVPLVLVGGGFMFLFANRLLPARQGVWEQLEQARQYAVIATVAARGPLEGKTIAQAGLRQLSHGYLAEIEREGHLITAPPPQTVLRDQDSLMFVGAPDCATELRRIHGLDVAADDVQKLELATHKRLLVEAVVGPDLPGLGRSIRDMRFRSRYGAVVLSVSRAGQPLTEKIGDIELHVGDTLLLEAGEDFVAQYRQRRDFLLVSALNDSTPPNFRKAPLALGILIAMVTLSALSIIPIFTAALLASLAMFATRCVTVSKARRQIDLSVIIVIASSFALGAAMTETGAAQQIADWLLFSDAMTPILALILVYFLTVVFTELITNNAAAVLMFPIALAIAGQLDAHYMPFVVAVMFAASASFITPLGYQTNLMVLGPGGYRFWDYPRIGLPMSLLTGATALTLIPLFWPF